MTLVDTSAWVEFLRKDGRDDVAERVTALLDSDEAAICGMVELELLQGLFPREARRVHGLVRALHYVDLDRADYVEAGNRLGALRERGITVPASDALIGTAAIRRALPLLTTDSHFRHFPQLACVPLPD